MKASEVHNLNDEELVERIRQTSDEQFALRLQHSTGELENTARISAVRAGGLLVRKEPPRDG